MRESEEGKKGKSHRRHILRERDTRLNCRIEWNTQVKIRARSARENLAEWEKFPSHLTRMAAADSLLTTGEKQARERDRDRAILARPLCVRPIDFAE